MAQLLVVFFFLLSVFSFGTFFKLANRVLELCNVLIWLSFERRVLKRRVFKLLLVLVQVLFAVENTDHTCSLRISFQLLSSFSCLLRLSMVLLILTNRLSDRFSAENFDALYIAILHLSLVAFVFSVFPPVFARHAFPAFTTCIPSGTWLSFPLGNDIPELSFLLLLFYLVHLFLEVRGRSL
jgi:hypothetical protein